MKNKVLVLGVDGLDPRLTKKYMDKGVIELSPKSWTL